MNTAVATVDKKPLGPIAEQFIEVPEAVGLETQRMLAELQASIILARSNPRDEVAAIERIMNACTRSSVAEHAKYEYPRGREVVSGPSISLVRTIARIWGSIESGFRMLGTENGETSVFVYAWDLEANVKSAMIVQVPLIRETSRGSYPLTSQRDIYEHVANMASRRLRACLLAVLPEDVVSDALLACEHTLSKSDQMQPDAVERLVAAFDEYGVRRPQIESHIGRRLESITSGQVLSLRKIYTSLKEGTAVASDWFKLDEEGSGSGSSKDNGNAKRADMIKKALKKAG